MHYTQHGINKLFFIKINQKFNINILKLQMYIK